MTTRLANGTRFAVSQVLSAAAAMTAISNANPAVVSAAAGLPAEGDIVLLESNWPDLLDVPARVGTVVAGTSFVALGIDTTDTEFFPAGEGGGTFRIASDYLSLNQVTDVSTSGGDQNNYTWQFLEDRSGRQRSTPTYKSAMYYTLTMAYDPDLPWHAALLALDKAREMVVLRETLPGGDVIYYAGYISYNGVPSKTINENMVVTATFYINSDPIRYEAA